MITNNPQCLVELIYFSNGVARPPWLFVCEEASKGKGIFFLLVAQRTNGSFPWFRCFFLAGGEEEKGSFATARPLIFLRRPTTVRTRTAQYVIFMNKTGISRLSIALCRKRLHAPTVKTPHRDNFATVHFPGAWQPKRRRKPRWFDRTTTTLPLTITPLK